ncbi:2-oxoacid:acceptor oxidoreductase family protein [Desulfobacula sp.]|uniref:2-oxoacid:acceptor oxidoreductase family protein n=1 Tax=Desulfobacula sp. TaxID=2593537 RepID=UPI0026112E0C|nr:2-oxoacid:acceptor oxidoreductase family protein [Desulfobacula sp.]
MTKTYDFSDYADMIIVLSGAAGQGIKTVEQVLTRLLKKQGFNVFSCKEYMSRVRGGVNSIQIRISPQRVDAWVDRIDILLPLCSDLSRLDHRISSKTMIIGEKNKITTQRPVIDFSFQAVAAAAGNKRYSNTVASSLILSLLGLDPFLLDTYLRKKFAKKSQKTIDENIAAMNMVLGAWYAGARGFATTSGGGFALMGEAMSPAGCSCRKNGEPFPDGYCRRG